MRKRILLLMLAMILAFAQVWALPVDSLRIKPQTNSFSNLRNAVELNDGNELLNGIRIKPVSELSALSGQTLNAAPAAIASIIAQYAPNIHFCEYDESVTFNNVEVGSTVTKTYEVWSHNVYNITEAIRVAINRTLGINVSVKVKLCLSQSSTLTNLDGIVTSNVFSVSPSLLRPSDIDLGEGGSRKKVSVTFKPTSAGTYKFRFAAMLDFYVGDRHLADWLTIIPIINVAGVEYWYGTAVNPSNPVITVSSTALTFGTVTKGESAIRKFTVKGTNLTSSVTVSSNNSNFTVSPTTITATQAKAGKVVTVTYKPTAVGTHSGTISISSGGAASKAVSVLGTCVAPTITSNVSSLAFGNVVKGKTASKTFTVTGTNLTGSLTLSSSNSNFTVTPTTITASEAAAGKTVTVTYKPTASGTHSGSVTISGGGAASRLVSVTGTCLDPSIITVNPTSLAFDIVIKGNTATKTFTVIASNLTGNLTLSSSNSNFTVSPTTITASEAAAGKTVTVTYKPTAAGSHSGTITISGGGATSKTVSVSGTCVVPGITVSVSSLAFGNVVKGNTSKKTFTIKATNLTGDLTVSSDNSNFTVSPTTITASEAAAGKTVTVTYKPTAVGSHSGTITISGGGVSITIPVTATCVVPTITPSVTSLALGTVVKGKTATKTFKVTGTNLTGSLTLSSNNSNFTVSPTSITAANAANGVTVTVTYKPTAEGSHSGSITISGGDAASKTVSVSGKCVVPSISVSPTSIAFGTVAKGQLVDKTFGLVGGYLTGNLTLSSSNSNFIVYPTSISAAEAVEGVTVTVTYKPTAAGSHTGTITISGGGAPSKTVSVSGTCVVPTITANPSSLRFASNSSQTFRVTGKNLTGSLSLIVKGGNGIFTVSPTSITASQAASGVTVTVSCAAGHNLQIAGATILITGGGASSTSVSVTYDAGGIEPYAPLVLPDEEESEDERYGGEFQTTQEVLGHSIADVNELVMDSKIYAEGLNIIIESPVEQSTIISDISGRARSVNLQAGRNEVPVNASGIYIVRVREKTVKLMLK